MKKHPVDDLFKRKLEGLERTPSQNAWLKIQEKQPGRSAKTRPANRRPVVWSWYAAAGVAAAVMGGYLVWQNQQVASPGEIRPQQTIAAAKPAQKDSVSSPIENSNEVVEQLAVGGKPDHAAAARETKRLARDLKITENNLAHAGKEQETEAQNIKKSSSLAAPVHNASVIALNERPVIPVNAVQPEPLKVPAAQDVKTLPDEPAVSQVNKPEPEPTRTIVVAVETGTNEAEEKPRNTRFARVFRQLKNARAGEKVDWEEVGFNPKDLVARVDDRLRNKEDRSSDKDHPKDKTKL